MYSFIDTIEGNTNSVSLPSEALQINGVYIENVIEGYRTLYTSGREMIAPEINSLELSKRHGSIYRSRRYPSRTITVGFQLIAPTNEEFRARFNALNGILYAEQAQLVFADEPDKCFYGTLSGVDSPEPGRNAVVGEFTFTCSDPFKYSVEEIEVEPSDGDYFIIDYGGTVEAWPTLQVDFPKHGQDGVCSYLAFLDADGNVIQLGGVDTESFVTDDAAENLVYEFFYTGLDAAIYCNTNVYCSDSLTCCLSSSWDSNDCDFLAGDDTVITTGSAAVSEEGSNGRLVASSYGSGTAFHGPSVSTTASASISGVVDFELAFQNYFEAAAIDEKGIFIATLNRVGESETVLASLVLVKSENQESAEALMIINGTVRKQVLLSLPLSGLSSRIAKEGSKVEFTFNSRTYVFYDDSLEDVGVHKVGFLLGAFATESPLSTNSLEWVRLTDAPRTFTNNDSVIADCRSATIKMNDISRPALDVIGNDWEKFVLTPGLNQIKAAYKSTAAKQPTFKIKYREVFL